MPWRISIAFDAVQGSTDELATTMLGCHPGPDLPGRVVSHVLAMRAFQICNPMPFLVLVKANDMAKHYGAPGCEPGPGRSSM